jgi:hypothetical protein
MTAKEDYYRRKAASEAHKKEKISNRWGAKVKDPMTLFTALVALFTFLLFIVAGLQWGTLEKTDHTLRSGQRGFAFVKEANWLATMRGGKIFWWALPNWENSGNTPITSVDFQLACPSIEGGAENIADPYALKRFTDLTGKTNRVSGQIGPKQSKFGGNCEFTVDDVKSIQASERTQYVIAQAKYFDVYGDSHVTRFCERVHNVRGDVNAIQNIQVAGIPCVRYNCSDEDCAKEDREPDLSPEKLKPLGPINVPMK